MNDILWTPPPVRAAASQMARFRRLAEVESGLDLPDWEALWRWSIDDRAAFWRLL